MAAPLVRPLIKSIYEVDGQRVLMQERMARSTPDMKQAVYRIRADGEAVGGKFALTNPVAGCIAATEVFRRNF